LLHRRGFLGVLAGLVAAPAIVKADAIMKIKPIDPVIDGVFEWGPWVNGAQYHPEIDAWVNDGYTLAPYKGKTVMDAGMFYCPYVPLQMVRAVDHPLAPDWTPETFYSKDFVEKHILYRSVKRKHNIWDKQGRTIKTLTWEG
jgi:hypothetical protein